MKFINPIVIIQARLMSTRFPYKVLSDIAGRPMLQHVIERAAAIPHVTNVVVATTDRPQDDPLEHVLKDWKVDYFRSDARLPDGDDDVLGRYYRAAVLWEADPIIRITADCPLIDPAIAGMVLTEHLKGLTDFVSNVDHTVTPPDSPFTFPPGLDVEVCSFTALERAMTEALDPEERQHVTLHFYRYAKTRYRCRFLRAAPSYRQVFLSVDTEAHRRRVDAICQLLEPHEFRLAATMLAWQAAGEP